MPDDDAPRPGPSMEGVALIARIYQFAMALKFAHIDVTEIRAALILTMHEAFTLIDHAHNGPWQFAVHVPPEPDTPRRIVRFDLETAPEPGMRWATLFGVNLIIEDSVEAEET